MKSLTPIVPFSLYPSCLCLIFAYSLFFTLCFCHHQSYSADKVECIPTERLALIQFKNSLVDPANLLSSWSGADCCSWSGVVCDNFTHHVHELRLHGPDDGIHGHCYAPDDAFFEEIKEADNQMLGGNISSSLVKLQQLRYLDLSCNDFNISRIPSFIGTLQNLRYLNLSLLAFGGEILHQLGNLSALLVLDLHGYPFYSIDLRSENLKWMENLKQLQHQDMSAVNLTGASSDWLQAINTLPSLQQLRLFWCHLTQIPSEPTTVSFNTSLILLDLSLNDFSGNMLPGWVFSLRKLITLDLSYCRIGGLSPGTHGGLHSFPSLMTLCLSGNTFVNTSSFLNGLSSLHNLRYLEVSDCGISDPILVRLQNLSLLVYLDLSANTIVEEIPKSLNNLCNLTTLDLSRNNFSGDVSKLLERFCECEPPKLEWLDLSHNSLTGRLPEKLGRLKNLAYIYMSHMRLTEPLPHSLGSLTLLKFLDLVSNQLEGSIPDSIGDLSSLKYLDLSDNRLNGSLPESIGKLGKLTALRLDHNSLTGVVTENHFANLTALRTLSVGDNKLVFNLVNNWIPPFQLNELGIGSCSLGPNFPLWLRSQTYLSWLDLSNTNISDTIPNWLWSTFYSLSFLNISHNNITGELEDSSTLFYFGAILDLSSNRFYGELPRNFIGLDILDLSSNNLSGSLDQFLCSEIQEPPLLRVLNLANNNISGGLPDCWMNWENLKILNLESNRLSGKIPSSLGNISSLESLDIRNNKLSGEIPMSLFNSKSLFIVKLAENELTGRIPTSIGRNHTSLIILSLRSNKLSGEIPNEICLLNSIQILDLADNNFFGNLPKCFRKFNVFSGKKKPIVYSYSYEVASINLMTKGHFYPYSTIVYQVTTIDLSNNKLAGSIPNELMSFPGLRFLNLSYNKLTGRIPDTVGEMRELESLDLSVNRLDGEIPLSLAGLTLLSLLNVSCNNLTGTIPTGTQLQTFNESCFIGNALCGAPLAVCQPNTHDGTGSNDDDDEKDGGIDWILVICMIVGLAVGFWVMIGSLIVSRQWRYAYYRFLDELWSMLADFYFLVFICIKTRVKFTRRRMQRVRLDKLAKLKDRVVDRISERA